MKQEQYDIIVIGGGAGGFVSAKMARGFGKKTALVEKRRLGGDCTWSGCIPSKALIKSASLAMQMGRMKDHGLKLPGKQAPDPSGVMDHVRSVINGVYQGHLPESFEREGIDVIFGAPRFINAKTIMVGDSVYRAKKFIIATGSGPMVPPIDGMDSVPYLTNETLFEMKKLPRSMAVMGGGPIGTELAMALNRLGVKTYLVEMMDGILLREDRELAGILEQALVSEGVKLHTSTRVVRVEKAKGGVKIHLADKSGNKSILQAETLLVAVGRKPNTEGLDLGKAGVACTAQGITTDRYLRTTAPDIYGCGDVVGPYQFSHMAEYQAVIAGGNALLPFKRKVNYDHVAWCTFTDPELAHAGMTEEEARDLYGSAVRVYRHDFKKTDRGITDGVKTGMSKIVLHKNGVILGAHILGPGAGEIMHEAQLAKTLGINFKKIRSVIHAYPSYSDVVRQPSKLFYVDSIRENPLVKLISFLLAKKSKE